MCLNFGDKSYSSWIQLLEHHASDQDETHRESNSPVPFCFPANPIKLATVIGAFLNSSFMTIDPFVVSNSA